MISAKRSPVWKVLTRSTPSSATMRQPIEITSWRSSGVTSSWPAG